MSQVLLVDDSHVYQEAIANLLKRNGLKVAIACDGVEALEQIQKSNPDLVVLDVVMPRMNGYEVCRRLKSDPRTKDVPVVMCSTKDMAWDRFWGLKIGADAYITKPFEEIEFMGTIKQLLRN